MNTDDLIGRLATDLKPIALLPSPARRTGMWLIAGVAYLGVVLGMVVLGRSSGAGTAQPLYVIEQCLAIALGISAAYAGFVTVVPGRDTRVVWAPVVTAAAWIGLLLWGCVRDVQTVGSLGLVGQTDWPCVVSIAVGGAVLWGVLAVMMRRGAPVSPWLSASLAGMAALSIANVEACVSRAHPFSSVVLVWHGGTMAVMVALLVLIGRRVIGWPELVER
ncbi:MAG: NrsF family protein [Vicinamibacterales bacterium]